MTHRAIVLWPMGLVNAIDLIQNFIRNFVYQIVGAPRDLEMRRDQPLPERRGA